MTISYVQTNLRLRYRKSILGFLWSVLAPLMSYIVIGYIFSKNSKTPMDNFFVYFFSGSVFFSFISMCVNRGTSVMIENENYIKKIYVPKTIFILNGIALELANFLLSLTALAFFGLASRSLSIHLSWIVIPIPVILATFALAGVCGLLSVAGVFFRDLIHIVPVLMQTIYFLTPVLYPARVLDGLAGKAMFLNPVYHFIEFFRTPITTGDWPGREHVIFCFVFTLIIFLSGFLVLKKFDNRIVFKL